MANLRSVGPYTVSAPEGPKMRTEHTAIAESTQMVLKITETCLKGQGNSRPYHIPCHRTTAQTSCHQGYWARVKTNTPWQRGLRLRLLPKSLPDTASWVLGLAGR